MSAWVAAAVVVSAGVNYYASEKASDRADDRADDLAAEAEAARLEAEERDKARRMNIDASESAKTKYGRVSGEKAMGSQDLMIKKDPTIGPATAGIGGGSRSGLGF